MATTEQLEKWLTNYADSYLGTAAASSLATSRASALAGDPYDEQKKVDACQAAKDLVAKLEAQLALARFAETLICGAGNPPPP